MHLAHAGSLRERAQRPLVRRIDTGVDTLAADPLDPSFRAKVCVLKEMILHHVEEEEKTLFPKVEKAMGKKLEQLGAEMETMFAEALEEGYEATLTKRAPQTSVDEALFATMQQGGLFGRPRSPSIA